MIILKNCISEINIDRYEESVEIVLKKKFIKWLFKNRLNYTIGTWYLDKVEKEAYRKWFQK